MSNFNNIKIGDTIYVTGIEADLYECNDDNYEVLLSVVNQFCKVVDVANNVDLYNLSDVDGDYCLEKTQRGVLIQSPKLQGHDGNGRCPEYNCYWIGKDYLSFESMSIDDTINIFDKLNESDEFGWAKEIIKDVPDVVDYRTVKQGDKVVPGKDWMFGNQAQGSVYGIVDLEQYGGQPRFIDDSTDEEFHQYWVHVDWVDKNGNPNFRNNYRVGPDYHDLKYYVPKPPKRKKSVKESEENIKEISHNDLEFGMRVVVNGDADNTIFNNELGTVVYNWNEDEEDTSNSFTIAFDTWDKGHHGGYGSTGNFSDVCGGNKCWSFYDDCAYSDEDYDGCENISELQFYTLNTYDLFDQLNESEDDEFGWAKETVSQEYHRYEDILPYLDFDDIISITGDFTDDYGHALLSVEDIPFKVYKKNNIVYLKWVQPEDERPIDWSSISNSSEEVHMGSTTFEWDKELMVKIVHKEEHPF